MSKEEILNKYIDLINKGYCCACNELNCIDNFPHVKITHAIRELQQENKKYKEVIDKAIKYIKIYRSYKKIDNKDYLKGRDEIGCLDICQVDELLDILKEVE